MIRKATSADAEKILQIWLNASIAAHSFIKADYWHSLLPEILNRYLASANTYVFEDKRQIKGFIALMDDNFIGALFVHPSWQRSRIGTKLLRYVRRRRPNMSLRVFAQNKNALHFYQSQGFQAVSENLETVTHAPELLMAWAQGCFSGYTKVFAGDS